MISVERRARGGFPHRHEAGRIRISGLDAYLARMGKAFDFCLPTRGTQVPSSSEWLHEIKYDGFRLRVEREGERVRLITRRLRLDQAIPLDR